MGRREGERERERKPCLFMHPYTYCQEHVYLVHLKLTLGDQVGKLKCWVGLFESTLPLLIQCPLKKLRGVTAHTSTYTHIYAPAYT